VTCVVVRERLAEFSLDVLDPSAASDVERHLATCAGCRKEVEELREGAAAVAFDLPAVAPPPALGAKVIGKVVRATGARPHRKTRRAWRVAGALGLAAAVLAAGALAQAVHTRDMQLKQAKAKVAEQSRHVTDLRKLLEQLRDEQLLNGNVYVAEFTAAPQVSGSGSAVIVDRHAGEDSLFMLVNVAAPVKQPLRVVLEQDGDAVAGATMVEGTEGYGLKGGIRFFEKELSGVSTIVVTDKAGKILLVGAVTLEPSPDTRAN
jgi:Putative zinc-finger